jgi:hypothetical protein
VVADLVTLAHQELQLLALVRRLIEQAVRTAGARKHEEGPGAAEVRLLAEERFEDPDAAPGIDLDVAVLLEIAKLTRRRVIEGEDDGRRSGWHRDAAVEQRMQALQAVAARVQPLEVTTEVLRCPRPPLFGVIDLVVLEHHDAAQLVRRKRLGVSRERKQQREREDEDGADHRAASVPSDRRAAPV